MQWISFVIRCARPRQRWLSFRTHFIAGEDALYVLSSADQYGDHALVEHVIKAALPHYLARKPRDRPQLSHSLLARFVRRTGRFDVELTINSCSTRPHSSTIVLSAR